MDHLGGVSDAFGEAGFLVETGEGTEADFEVETVRPGLGGEFDDLAIGNAGAEPFNEDEFVFNGKIGQAFVGASGGKE